MRLQPASAGIITWDRDAGLWSFDLDDVPTLTDAQNDSLVETFAQAHNMQAVPFRDAIERNGVIFDVSTYITPDSPLFMRALESYLIDVSGWVMELRIDRDTER